MCDDLGGDPKAHHQKKALFFSDFLFTKKVSFFHKNRAMYGGSSWFLGPQKSPNIIWFGSPRTPPPKKKAHKFKFYYRMGFLPSFLVRRRRYATMAMHGYGWMDGAPKTQKNLWSLSSSASDPKRQSSKAQKLNQKIIYGFPLIGPKKKQAVALISPKNYG